MRFGPIRINFSYLRIFGGVQQATVFDETELPGVHSSCTQGVYLSICVPVCLCTNFEMGWSAILFFKKTE